MHLRYEHRSAVQMIIIAVDSPNTTNYGGWLTGQRNRETSSHPILSSSPTHPEWSLRIFRIHFSEFQYLSESCYLSIIKNKIWSQTFLELSFWIFGSHLGDICIFGFENLCDECIRVCCVAICQNCGNLAAVITMKSRQKSRYDDLYDDCKPFSDDNT